MTTAQGLSHHDIFLSHSGKQKGFVKDLYHSLSSMGYAVFFDQDDRDRSLPLGQPFPPHIFDAAHSCTLAIVVLSEDFLTTRWPMTELCEFADRLTSPDAEADSSYSITFTILPLFFEVLPEDLKRKEKVAKWRNNWETFEQRDGRGRFSAEKCEQVVTKILPCRNGIIRGHTSDQGEASYIKLVTARICSILPPIQKFTIAPNDRYSGRERLCEIILHKFRMLELLQPDPSSSASKLDLLQQPHPSSSNHRNYDACTIVGMYGVPGSGKSTLCRFLCDSMFGEFRGNVFHLEMPTKTSSSLWGDLSKRCGELLSRFTSHIDVSSMDLDTVLNLLSQARCTHKMFVVLDNISQSDDKCPINERLLHTILNSAIVGPGSRIMLVAQTSAILENLLICTAGRHSEYRYTITEIPCLIETEAREIIRYSYPSVKDAVLNQLLRKSSFGPSSPTYIPFVFEQIGVLLRKMRHRNVEELDSNLDQLWKLVSEGKKDAIQKLVATNITQLSEELQLLFFDITLFIIPAGYSKLCDAIPILSSIHMDDDLDCIVIKKKIDELREHCSLSIIEEELQIHDMFVLYAESSPKNSIYYLSKPSLQQILGAHRSSSADESDLANWVHFKWPEARTITICPDYDHYYKDTKDDCDIRLHVEVGAKTKAVVVRNDSSYFSTRSINCALGLSGELSSLVWLKMENVQRFAIWPSTSDAHLSSLVTLEVRNENTKDLEIPTYSGQKRKRTRNSFLDLISHPFRNSKQYLMWLRIPSMSPWQQPCRLASYNDVMHSLATSGRMTRLRVLILVNAGIRSLEDIGRYFPQLEDLEINDEHQNLMLVSIGSAPKLKRLATGETFSHKRSHEWEWPYRFINRSEYSPAKSSKLVLQLGECPELKEVWMDVFSFEQVEVVGQLPSTLRHFGLAHYRNVEVLPPISRQLKRLEIVRNLQVERLNFTSHWLDLPSLEVLYIEDCNNLAHLSINPHCLQKLRHVNVGSCYKLSTFAGLENVVKGHLDELQLRSLPHLHCDLRFRGMRLREMEVRRCPGVKINQNLLESSKSLWRIELEETCIVTAVERDLQSALLMVNNLEALYILHLKRISLHHLNSNIIEEGLRADQNIISCSTTTTSKSDCMLLCCDPCGDEHCDDTPNEILKLRHATALKIRDAQFTFLYSMELEGGQLEHLQEIEGLQYLLKLGFLILTDLPSLTRVSGGWPPEIQRIHFGQCPNLQEVPPLPPPDHTPELHSLEFVECAKLKAVEGKFDSKYSCHAILFMGCESMALQPEFEGYHRSKVQILRVSGSKFASVEVMRGWLNTAESWSSLFNAAVHGLMWEYVKKGEMDALAALQDYFSALSSQDLHPNRPDRVGQNLSAIMHSCSPPEWYDFKEHEVSSFMEWIRNKFCKL